MKFYSLFAQCGGSLKESIFSESSGEFLAFDLPKPEEVTLHEVCSADYLSQQPFCVGTLQQKLLHEMEAYQLCRQKLLAMTEQQSLQETAEGLRQYRIQRKALQQQKRELEESAEREALQQLYGSQEKRQTICWKGMLYATELRNLSSFLPPLQAISGESTLWQTPLFTANITQWKEAVFEKRRMAVEGGPCLFGVDEMKVLLKMQSGKQYAFDFVTEQLCASSGDSCRLSEFAAEHSGEGKSVRFQLSKTALTEAEYQSLLHVFHVAEAFGADAYIPLPDFSYQKYMNVILKNLLPSDAERFAAEAACSEALCAVTRLYLREIQQLKQRFPKVRVTVISMESSEQRQKYQEMRKPFLRSDCHMLKTLTGRAAKREAILDYITMPALPYYLDGITDIIQVDCLDEGDSYRKCRKLHKGTLHIYPLLYPEALSGDGQHTIYYAKKQWKQYRKGENQNGG